jgi:hypothetical protein
MQDNQCPRRRRNQSEIDRLVQEFRSSGLSQQEFAEKIGVHLVTVVRWMRTTSVDINQPAVGSSSREVAPTSPSNFVAVEVRPSLSPRAPAVAAPSDWPEIVAPNGWKLRVPLGGEFGWVGELLAQLPQC